jgi:hypothetical protein
MAIEKSLYSESDPDVLAALEIEIENPDSVTISDGDNVISLEVIWLMALTPTELVAMTGKSPI